MPTFLQEEMGVAMSGVKWDIGNFKLWQSTKDDIILFVPKQPVLAKQGNGRYQVAVSSFFQQKDNTYKITGGSAVFTITSAVQFDPAQMQRLQEQWRAEVGGSGRAVSRNPRFIPLNVRKGEATVLINPESGTPDPAHNDKDVGTPGGTNSFLIRLTELGAQEWAQGIKNKTNIPAGVKFTYEYLQLLPTVGARVVVHGQRAFTHFSTSFKASAKWGFWGGKAQIDAAWENMTRDGTVEITFVGTPPPEMVALRDTLVTSFANQAKEMLFKSLFEPAPDVKPAEAGEPSGGFLGFGGGASFALKWKKQTETTDLKLDLKFEGWTWLKASMDADMGALFGGLDASYVTEVQTQQSFPASLVVDADEMLEKVAVSWSASQGKSPEAPVFGGDGGNATYTVTSQNPDAVTCRYKAQVVFTPRSWPVISTEGQGLVKDGGNQIVLKPSSWIGRHWIYMFVRDGDRVLGPSELTPDDYLVVNVSYTGPHLPRAITDSAKISPLEPIQFSYPMSPTGERGQAKFSAFGVIQNKMVRASDQAISFAEDAVFILASKEGIRLVSKDAALPEDDQLAKRLLAAGARPLAIGSGMGEEGGEPTGGSNGKYLTGRLVAVEYSTVGPALWLETGGGRKKVKLRSAREALPFDDEGPKRVKVKLDAAGEYADSVVVMLES